MKLKLSELRSIVKEETKLLVEMGWGHRGHQRRPERGVRAVGTIFLPTPSALALWNEEIRGQLSDGMWENSSPSDHWIFWSNMEATLGPPKTVANETPVKNSYNLSSLIDVVGDRMLKTGKMGLAGITDRPVLSASDYMPATYEEFARNKESGSWQYDFVKKYMDAVDLSLAKKFYAAKYDMNDLKRDLRSIKVAMKNVEFKSDVGKSKAAPAPPPAPVAATEPKAEPRNPAWDDPNVIQQ